MEVHNKTYPLIQARDDNIKGFRLAWWLLYFIGAVGTAISVSSVILNYLEYNVVTKVRVERNKAGIDFPSVTFCNKNRVHCGRLLDMIA